MGKNKALIIISWVFVAVLSALTILYAVLKHNETYDHVLYNIYSDIAIYFVVIWQIVVVILCILVWKKVFNDGLPKAYFYVGRTVSLIITCAALLFLADQWLNLFLADSGEVVMEKGDHILIYHPGYDGEGSYSIWSKDGPFYRKFGINIGYYADSVAEGMFYSYVNGFADNTGISPELSSSDNSAEMSEVKDKEIVIAMPLISESFDISVYISDGYDREALYSGLYDLVDKNLTSADYPLKDSDYGKLQFVDNGDDEYLRGIEPDCSYISEDGVTYGILQSLCHS